MANFYISPISGNNTNNGTSWLSAWQNLNGATAAILNAGDNVYIEKSPDPTNVGSAAWTNGSYQISLSSSPCMTLNKFEVGTDLSATTNVTITTETTNRKVGAGACRITTNASFVSGDLAYFNLTDTQTNTLSSYEKINFWLNVVTTAISNSADLQLNLYSDTGRTTLVSSYNLNAFPLINMYQSNVIDNKGPLPSGIKTIALNTKIAQASKVYYIDHMFVSKASSANDALCLNCLVGKNTANESWYPIRAVDGNLIQLDMDPQLKGSTLPYGYYGVSETANLYSRNTFLTYPIAPTITTTVQAILDSGSSSSSALNISGGINPTTNIQDGLSIFNGTNGTGHGLLISSKNYINLSNVGFTRYSRGTQFDTCIGVSGYNIHNSAANIYAFDLQNTQGEFNNINCNASPYGFNITTGSNIIKNSKCIGSNYNFNSNATLAAYNCIMANGAIGINAYSQNNAKFYNCLIDKNTSQAVSTQSGFIDLYNCSLYNSTYAIQNSTGGSYTSLINCAVSGITSLTVQFGGGRTSETSVRFTNFNNTQNDDRVYFSNGTCFKSTDQLHGSTSYSWKISITNTDASYIRPLYIPIAKLICIANTPTSISVYARRGNTTTTAQICIYEQALTGITSDLISKMTATADTWEQLTLNFTPTQNGVVTVYGQAYNNTTTTNSNVWFGDITLPTAIETKEMNFTDTGFPLVVNAGGSSSSAKTYAYAFIE